jgi:hypothetical protein
MIGPALILQKLMSGHKHENATALETEQGSTIKPMVLDAMHFVNLSVMSGYMRSCLEENLTSYISYVTCLSAEKNPRENLKKVKLQRL